MLRSLSFLAVAMVLCSGQMCGVVPNSELPTPDAGSQMGIPAGVYSGDVTDTTTWTYYSLDGEEVMDDAPFTYQVTKEFASFGGLTTSSGSALAPGDFASTEDGSQTVDSVYMDWGKYVVIMLITMDAPDFGGLFGEPLHFTGMDTITYTDLGSGRVKFEAEERAASQWVNGQNVSFVAIRSGVLRR